MPIGHRFSYHPLADLRGFEPTADCRSRVRLLFSAEWPARGDPVPLREASSAASRSGMLRDENRVAAKWRLLAVVRWQGRREPPGEESARVLEHRALSLLIQTRAFLRAAREPTAKG